MRSVPWWVWVGAGLAMVAYWSNKTAEQKRKQQAQAAKSPQIPVINPLPGQSDGQIAPYVPKPTAQPSNTFVMRPDVNLTLDR